jgi:3-isopropylmalate dehydratase small subunit
MQAFTQLSGIAVPLDRANVDTDMIIPKQFLKSIKRSGFGPNLFDELRYLDEGQPDQDSTQRPINPDFVLNYPRYQGRTLVVGQAANMPLGRYLILVFHALSPQALLTFFIITVLKMASYPLPYWMSRWINCLKMHKVNLGSS